MSFMMMLKTLPVGVKILGGAALSYGAFSWMKHRSPSNQAVDGVVDGVLTPGVEEKVRKAIASSPNIASLSQLGDGLAKAGAMQLATVAHAKAAMLQGGAISASRGPAISALAALPTPSKQPAIDAANQITSMLGLRPGATPPAPTASSLIPTPSLSGVADMISRAIGAAPTPQPSGGSSGGTVGSFIASLSGNASFHL